METSFLTTKPLKEPQTPGTEIHARINRLENLIYLLLIIWFISAVIMLSFTAEGNILAGNVTEGIKKKNTQNNRMVFSEVKDKSTAQNYIHKGWNCFLEGKDSQAMLCCSLALREDPEYAPAYALKSCIYEEMGCPEKAVLEMDKAIRFDPVRKDIYIAIRRNIKDRSEQSATL